jgi:hypothetical protein
LVIRVWVEHEHPLVARITVRGDVHADEESSTVVTGTEAAVGVVREWLAAFAGTGGDS